MRAFTCGRRAGDRPERTSDDSLTSTPEPELFEGSFHEIAANWLALTYALNAINRSVGSGDLYPFVLAEPVIEKLAFVHDCVEAGIPHS